MRKVSLLLLLMSACIGEEPAADRVTLTVPERRTAPGDSIGLVVTNATNGPIGYNLCPSTLSFEAGGSWTPISSDRVCTMELRTLEPDGDDRFDFELPIDLEPGRYRFETDIVHLATDAREGIASDPFEVE